MGHHWIVTWLSIELTNLKPHPSSSFCHCHLDILKREKSTDTFPLLETPWILGCFTVPQFFTFLYWFLINLSPFYICPQKSTPLIFSAFDNELGASVLSRSLMVAIICYFRAWDHVELGREGVHHSKELCIIPGHNFLYILEFSMPVLLKTKVIVAYSRIRCRSWSQVSWLAGQDILTFSEINHRMYSI